MNPALMELYLARITGSDLPNAPEFIPPISDIPDREAMTIERGAGYPATNVVKRGMPGYKPGSMMGGYNPNLEQTRKMEIVPGTNGMVEAPKLPPPGLAEHLAAQAERKRTWNQQPDNSDIIGDFIRRGMAEREQRKLAIENEYRAAKGLSPKERPAAHMSDIYSILEEKARRERLAEAGMMQEDAAPVNQNDPYGMLQQDVNQLQQDVQNAAVTGAPGTSVADALGIQGVDTGYDTYPDVGTNEAARMESQRNGGRGSAISSGPSSPIERGVQSAMQARRASYDIDDQQRQQAMGLAIMRMAQSYASSKNTSNLGAINEAFSPAVDTYISERDKFKNLNKEAAIEARKAERDKFDMDIKLQELAIKRHNGGVTASEGRLIDQYETTLNKQYLELETNKEKELNNYIKNQLKDKWGPEKEALIERKKADLERKYQFSKNNLEKKMRARGLEIADKVEARENQEAQVPNSVVGTAPQATEILNTTVTTPEGELDFDNMTPEQLKKFGAV